jgi:hypothetical protein
VNTPFKPSISDTPLTPPERLRLLFVMLAALSGVVFVGSGITSVIRCLAPGQHGFHMGAGLAGWITLGAFIAFLVFLAGTIATGPRPQLARRR